MTGHKPHISSFSSLATVLVILLLLTTLSVAVTSYHLGAFAVAIALIIASIKVATVITQFMHMKFESLFLKLMISGVFVIFALVIVITFIDYYFR
ncbi:MAG TPA: cytochrome C oxidase subunit IV family protein [Bacteroidales bacterium]|nr:cytochrome C oxidase subunit IV family protein [Bacteroidales bacterium]